MTHLRKSCGIVIKSPFIIKQKVVRPRRIHTLSVGRWNYDSHHQQGQCTAERASRKLDQMLFVLAQELKVLTKKGTLHLLGTQSFLEQDNPHLPNHWVGQTVFKGGFTAGRTGFIFISSKWFQKYLLFPEMALSKCSQKKSDRDFVKTSTEWVQKGFTIEYKLLILKKIKWTF